MLFGMLYNKIVFNIISSDMQISYGSFIFQEDQTVNENDTELIKCLNKQRRRAIAAARAGRRSIGSRNSYKDKGGRSSQNSKIQKQLNSW